MLDFQRTHLKILVQRLAEPAYRLVVVAGPRQVGKTTLVRAALRNFEHSKYVSADATEEPSFAAFSMSPDETMESPGVRRDATWLVRIWQEARLLAKQADENGFILAIDEIQAIPQWSEVVKGLWDADRLAGLDLRVVLLGSSPLLVQKGLRESLAGRFEPIPMVSHWSYPEMHDAFGLSLEDYLYFGGYPGSASWVRDEPRWRNYVRDALIHPAISKDILLLNRVDKPALLSQLFQLGCEYSGQILALSKMAPHLQDDGEKAHTATLSHYLELMTQAGLLTGLQKYTGSKLRRRGSSPKLLVLNTAMMSLANGADFVAARQDRTHWGRLVESAVGAHLFNTGVPDCQLYYWSEASDEVDFVLARGRLLTAIEVKSGRKRAHVRGFDAFENAFGQCRRLVVGEGGISLPEFFSFPAEHWLPEKP